jgi:hypothetical protein
MTTRYLAKSGCHYVKAIDGKPCYRSTHEVKDAARFDSEAAALAWAPNVFAKSALAAVEAVPAPDTRQAATRPVRRYESNYHFNDEPNMPWDH